MLFRSWIVDFMARSQVRARGIDVGTFEEVLHLNAFIYVRVIDCVMYLSIDKKTL